MYKKKKKRLDVNNRYFNSHFMDNGMKEGYLINDTTSHLATQLTAS
jgi:hypothetical protein